MESYEDCCDKLRGGRTIGKRPVVDEFPRGGNCIPPSGATVGEKSGRFVIVSKCFKALGRAWKGVCGIKDGALCASWPVTVVSAVVIVNPRLLGFLFGGFIGTRKEGDAGVEEA